MNFTGGYGQKHGPPTSRYLWQGARSGSSASVSLRGGCKCARWGTVPAGRRRPSKIMSNRKRSRSLGSWRPEGNLIRPCLGFKGREWKKWERNLRKKRRVGFRWVPLCFELGLGGKRAGIHRNGWWRMVLEFPFTEPYTA